MDSSSTMEESGYNISARISAEKEEKDTECSEDGDYENLDEKAGKDAEEGYVSQEEIKNWSDRVFVDIERRKGVLAKHYGFDKKHFASEYEQNIGLDFSVTFLENCYPVEFLKWPMEKQAQLANAEVRAAVLHKDGWSMKGIRNNTNVCLMVIRLLFLFRTNAEMMGNLAYQALYSNDLACQKRAYFVYWVSTWLIRIFQPKPLVYGSILFFITWLLLPVTIWYPAYITICTVSLVGFMWCLLHLNILFGEYRRRVQPEEQEKWNGVTMEDVKTLPEDKKRVFDLIQMRVWSARIGLAKYGDMLKEKVK
jgi:hypothetical protein